MDRLENQNKTHIVDALKKYRSNRVVSFDVPGHKQGKSNRALVDFFGEDAVSIDYNSSKPLDNGTYPVSVIKEAQELASEAFGSS